MLRWLCLNLVALGLALGQSYPQEYPFPRRFLDPSPEITFCLDKQNPLWELEQAIARELARSLGRPARFYLHRDEPLNPDQPPIPVSRREFQVLLATQCDVYMGLLGSTTPAFDYPADEQMLATRPYLRSRYLLVSRNPRLTNWRTLPPDLELGLVMRSLPYSLILRQTRRPRVFPAVSSQSLLNHLLSGRLQVGILFAPALYGPVRDPRARGLSVTPLDLPNSEWLVIAGVAKDRPSLRNQLDGAILRLLQSGRIGRLVEGLGLPTQIFSPASPRDRRPESESDEGR